MKFRPTIGTDMSGRMGGVVASHNTYGSYFRSLVRPVNRNTPGQAFIRSNFGALSQSWRGLTSGERSSFSAAAPLLTVPDRTGGSLTLTGQALYMRINQLRALIALPLLNAPPTDSTVAKLSQPTVTVYPDGSCAILYSAGDPWNATGGGAFVSVSALTSAGRSYIGQYFAMPDGEGGSQGPLTESDPTLPFSLGNGNGTLRFRFRAVTADGRLSPLVYVDVAVPALVSVVAVTRVDATHLNVEFSGDVLAAQVGAAADLTAGASVTAVAQGADNQHLIFTGTTFVVGGPWSLNPTGAYGTFVIPASGLVV